MITLLNLPAQYEQLKDEIDDAILKTFQNAQFVLGSEVEALEKEFAEFCNVKYAIAVNSGTSALHLACLNCDLNAGDEVITVSSTFVATIAAIRYTGAIPVFVDIDMNSYTIDADQIEKAITKKTKAIIPVHLYGHPADMEKILAIAKKYDLKIIEDASQAHGATYKGKTVGGFGDIGCFSFYPGKNLGAAGEGGMLVTNSEDIYKYSRMLRDWGQEEKGNHVVKGYNYRMDGIQGTILRIKLRYLRKWNQSRRRKARLYTELLNDLPLNLPNISQNIEHVHHVYPIRTKERDNLREFLNSNDIQTGIHYPQPVHLSTAHKDLGYVKGDFPNSEILAETELSLPIYPELDESAQKKIAKKIKLFFAD